MDSAAKKRRVIVESPYYSIDEAEQNRNIEYAIECLRDSLYRGEAPFASHLLYTRVTDDAVAEERRLGLLAAMEWVGSSEYTAIYIDRGFSAGMRLGIQHAYAPFRIAVRTLRQNYVRADRVLRAYERKPVISIPSNECDHQLEAPLIRLDGDKHFIDGWRCGCGLKMADRERFP